MRAEKWVESPGETLLDLLLSYRKSPAQVAARTKKNGRWFDVTWGEVLDQVEKIAAGLVALGVKPGDRVAIFANTSLQWVLSDLAISVARGICVPIYASNTPDECRFILNNSGTKVLFVDDDVSDGKQAGRLSRVRQKFGECSTLSHVVAFDAQVHGPKEVSWSDFLQKSGGAHAGLLEDAARTLTANDATCFIYTSGTTGDPKGVILTHGNFTYEAQSVQRMGLARSGDSLLLFLPMAHVFAQAIKALWLRQGLELIFAESLDKLLANLSETRPTILPAVPRVFEKVFNGVMSNGLSAPGVKGKLFRWAMTHFDRYVEARAAGRTYSSVGFTLARRLVFSKVEATLKEKLGGKIRVLFSGSAPLATKIAYFFDLIGLPVNEGYGLTETTAGASLVSMDQIKIGTVGKALPGSDIKIAPDGEILIRGPNVMKGYHQNDAATAEVIDSEGWFHSGDIGELDEHGYLRITDRKKDIIVTAGGKNVAPQNLEGLLKTFPIVGQCMVYGDRRQYLTVLICVAEDVGRKVLAEKGLTASDYADLSRRPEIHEAVKAAIDSVNARLPPYQTLKRFAVLDRDFTQETGELTPTLKVKRKLCTQKYKPVLDSLYDEKALH
jgi:long-chain acyl-CoA synthetase